MKVRHGTKENKARTSQRLDARVKGPRSTIVFADASPTKHKAAMATMASQPGNPLRIRLGDVGRPQTSP